MKKAPRAGSIWTLIAAVLAALVLAPSAGFGEEHEVLAEQAGDLTLELVAEADTVEPGGQITYYVIYANAAEVAHPGAEVRVTAPDGMTVAEAGGGVVLEADQEVVWELGEVAAASGGVLELTLDVGLDAEVGTEVVLTGTIESELMTEVTAAGEPVTVGPELRLPVFQGYPGGAYGPDRSVTRAEVAAVVARVLDLRDRVQGWQVFSDVPPDHWAVDFVEAIYREGIMVGYDDGTFRPEQAITRAELAAVMLRLQVEHLVPFSLFDPTTDVFVDVPPTHWAYDTVRLSSLMGRIEGYPDATFRPDEAVRRDEAAKLFAAGLARGELVDGDVEVVQHFPDVERQDWSFGWVAGVSKEAFRSVYQGDATERLIEYVEDAPPVWWD